MFIEDEESLNSGDDEDGPPSKAPLASQERPKPGHGQRRPGLFGVFFLS